MPSSDYSAPDQVSYNTGVYAFTNALAVVLAPVRRASQFALINLGVVATVLFTAVTTPAYVRLGKSGSLAAFAELALGTLAANASLEIPEANVFKKSVNLSAESIPLGPTLSIVAPTGGSPAGTGMLTVTLGWS